MVHSDSDDQDLRRSALVALHAGIIPRDRPQQILGGSGSGEVCPVCGRSIEPAEMELELEFAVTEGGNAAREFHLHLPCFAAWEIARKSVADDRAASTR